MSSCTSIANLHSEDESIKSQGTAKRDDIHKVFLDYAIATASDLEHLYQPGQNGVEPGADKPLSGKVKRSDQFPMKLHVMLTVVEDLGLAHIVSWKVHGRAPKIFPLFFRQSKITSFQRQLNLPVLSTREIFPLLGHVQDEGQGGLQEVNKESLGTQGYGTRLLYV